MLKFIVRRIFWTIPVLLVVIFLTFMMMRQIEGNPFRQTERAVPAAVQANLERKFNVDKPWCMQYLYYVKGVFTFDLGPSLVVRGRDVNDIVKTHFPKSIELGLYAFIFAIIVGVPLGVIAALKHNTVVDYSAMFFSNIFHAIPSFLVATLLIYFIALEFGALPTSGWTSWEHKILPVDRARLRPDGALRAARARDDARDAAAGLRPHGEGEGVALPPRRRACTCSATR